MTEKRAFFKEASQKGIADNGFMPIQCGPMGNETGLFIKAVIA